MRAEAISSNRPTSGKTPAGKSTSGKAEAQDAGSALTDGMDREQAKEVRLELLLERQRDRFDYQTEERTELEREYNTMRDMMVAQEKNDDEIVKKYVAMI